jgi:probable rRNA maturation factor
MLEMVNNTKTKLCQRKARRLSEGILKFYHLEDKEVSLVIVGDKKMRSLNRDYRGLDQATDVLSFPAEENMTNKEEGGNLLGEIFINIDEAKRTNKYIELFGRKRGYQYIFYFLFVHGLLHLIGYDDRTETERKVMVALGEKFMNSYYQK